MSALEHVRFRQVSLYADDDDLPLFEDSIERVRFQLIETAVSGFGRLKQPCRKRRNIGEAHETTPTFHIIDFQNQFECSLSLLGVHNGVHKGVQIGVQIRGPYCGYPSETHSIIERKT